jgi:hypothetical protein
MDDLTGLVVIWLVLAALVGWAATTKGKNGLTWFLFAFLFSPLIAGIAILISQPEQTAPPVPANIGDELSKFAGLRESGAITPEEFETQKARLLALTVAPLGPRAAGARCGRCGKPLSPAWKTKCNHCRATFAEYPPVLPT